MDTGQQQSDAFQEPSEEEPARINWDAIGCVALAVIVAAVAYHEKISALLAHILEIGAKHRYSLCVFGLIVLIAGTLLVIEHRDWWRHGSKRQL